MDFRIKTDILRSQPIGVQEKILLLGSCFSDNIAGKMQSCHLQATGNPWGTLYNPVSVGRKIPYLCPTDGGNDHRSVEEWLQPSVVIVTFGTAWVYVDRCVDECVETSRMRAEVRDRCVGKCEEVNGMRAEVRDRCVETGDRVAVEDRYSVWEGMEDWMERVVDNCQKRPSTDFERRRLTVEEIVRLWNGLLCANRNIRFIFTVSPIRHIKDGLHENQISKGILLQAVDELTREHANAEYFPSYEILMDELRDYRFYAADMMHPSDVAVEYIWQRFRETYFYPMETQAAMKELHQLWLDEQHRPLQAESEENQAFQQRTRKHRQELKNQYPWL